MTTKKAREFFIGIDNDGFPRWISAHENFQPISTEESVHWVETIKVLEVLPVDPITEGDIVTASNEHQVEAHKSNDAEWSPRASFQAGARWAIEEMKKLEGGQDE